MYSTKPANDVTEHNDAAFNSSLTQNINDFSSVEILIQHQCHLSSSRQNNDATKGNDIIIEKRWVFKIKEHLTINTRNLTEKFLICDLFDD